MKWSSCAVFAVLSLFWGAGAAQAQPDSSGTGQPRAVKDSLRLVVMIHGVAPDGVKYGAGLIIGHRGRQVYVLTAAHVLRGSRKRLFSNLTASLWSAPDEAVRDPLALKPLFFKEKKEGAEKEEEEQDLAIASFLLPDESYLKELSFDALSDDKNLPESQQLCLVGNPRGEPWSYSTSGNILREPLGGKLIRFKSSDVKPGSSGGGLFTDDWELIGVVQNTVTSESYAFPINEALKWASSKNIPVALRPHVAIYGFSSNPETLLVEGEAKLSWRASPSASCRIEPQIEGVEARGARFTGRLKETTRYTLSCTAPGHRDPINRHWVIEVIKPPMVTIEAQSDVEPPGGAKGGQGEGLPVDRILLKWKAENARKCLMDGEEVPPSGEKVVEVVDPRLYTLFCYNGILAGAATTYAEARTSRKKRQYILKGLSGPIAMDIGAQGPKGVRLELTIPALPAMKSLIGSEVAVYPTTGTVKWSHYSDQLSNRRKLVIREGTRSLAELREAAEKERLLLERALEREAQARKALQDVLKQSGVELQKANDALLGLRRASANLGLAQVSRQDPEYQATLSLAKRNVRSEEQSLASLGVPLELARNLLKAEEDVALHKRSSPYLELEEALRVASRKALAVQLRGVPELHDYTEGFGERGVLMTRFKPPYAAALLESNDYRPALLLYTPDHRIALFEGGNNRVYFTPAPEVDNHYVKVEKDAEQVQIYWGRTLSGDRVQGRRAYYPRTLRKDGLPEASQRIPIKAHRTLYSIGGKDQPYDRLCFFAGGAEEPPQKCFKIEWKDQQVMSISDDGGPVERLEWLLRFAREQRTRATPRPGAVSDAAAR
jgi:hypothetical protein